MCLRASVKLGQVSDSAQDLAHRFSVNSIDASEDLSLTSLTFSLLPLVSGINHTQLCKVGDPKSPPYLTHCPKVGPLFHLTSESQDQKSWGYDS